MSIRRTLLVILAASCLFVAAAVPAAAARSTVPLPTVLVDVSRAGHLPAAKAIGKWNAGLTTFQLQAVSACSGTKCLHIVQVFNGPTFLCTNPWGCSSSGGLTDGSCTVEVDRGALLDMNRRQYGNLQNLVLSVLLHEMGHGITGTWRTDGSMGFDCVGLSHDQRYPTSVMQNPLSVPVPTVPDAQNYAEASALF